ncbi:hypothetical protein Y919_12560 [Caloranaerobacter azorensis H53214]|uniref:Uncharacterized protein n=1 Tax=Caloranaerobacter azorensis H53214 TaxID=1156417 RepID=A0A096BDY8_9FIRM|nr:hypothetical protein Y919_12560 [Caloranaerobacter azorensis H53214]
MFAIFFPAAVERFQFLIGTLITIPEHFDGDYVIKMFQFLIGTLITVTWNIYIPVEEGCFNSL